MSERKRQIERLCKAYFSNPAQTMRVAKGDRLLSRGRVNNKLFYVLGGTFGGGIELCDDYGNREPLELFRSGPKSFLGVNSFFSYSNRSSLDVTALSEGEVAWIDRSTGAVDEQIYGSLREQFFPIVMAEISRRQIRLSEASLEHELALRRLHMAEANLATLGQLSAGLVHELNNAISVLVRASDRVREEMHALLRKHEPALLQWFEKGVAAGQPYGSRQVRERARELSKRFKIDYESAKTLARIWEDSPIEALPDPLDEAIAIWEAGRDCYDMRLASRHAADIVRSVKQLKGSGQEREAGLDVNSTLLEALALLQSNLREVHVEQRFDPELPTIIGSRTELVQIWLNIVKNAWDALQEDATPNPCISLSSSKKGSSIEVMIENNGPPIPESFMDSLFQPNITTKKKSGESMGLGLGLYMVKRLVESYRGVIEVSSTKALTRFAVRLPLPECPLAGT